MGTAEGGARSQARVPTLAANAVRLPMRNPTHGEPDENAFQRLP